jgi:hypothetical protein
MRELDIQGFILDSLRRQVLDTLCERSERVEAGMTSATLP